MSVDLWLGCQDDAFSVNFTYNYGQMWGLASGTTTRTVEIDGLTGAQSLVLLEHSVGVMERAMPAFRAINPSNGWGDADHFLSALKDCIKAAKEHPRRVWAAHR